MNSEVTDLDAHARAAREIPWYVNGTLAAAEASDLEAHLRECAGCRADYEGQVRLFEAVQADCSLAFSAESSFQKLMARIGDGADTQALLGHGPTPPIIRPPSVRAPVRSHAVRWLAAAAVLEAVCLGYGGWSWHARVAAPASYVTLTSPEASYRSSPRVRVVFRAGLSVQQLGLVLQGVGAHIVDGPTTANVYTLGFTGSAVTPATVEQRAATLRANSDVLFAEPLAAPADDGSRGSR